MIFRVARHTNQLDRITDFYVTVIGLQVLGGFKDHAGYDGVFLGKDNFSWHLEFTQTGELPQHTFDKDDALVFYPETQHEFDALVCRINDHNLAKVTPKNPYWQQNGIPIHDPDGYVIVISPLQIKKE